MTQYPTIADRNLGQAGENTQWCVSSTWLLSLTTRTRQPDFTLVSNYTKIMTVYPLASLNQVAFRTYHTNQVTNLEL